MSGSTNGTGTAARFGYLSALAIDGGNLYVDDTSNQTIRKVVLSTATVTTLAGAAGSAGSLDGRHLSALQSPIGSAADGMGVSMSRIRGIARFARSTSRAVQ
jgi:hypothetical protein